MSDITQLIIIGGGPAAWSAALYAGRAAIRPLVFTGENPGGQLMLTTEVENFPGFTEGIDGPLLMNQMRQQAERFDTRINDEAVERIEKTDKGIVVYATSGPYLAQAVIVATGAQARWLDVPGEKELVGKGVSACAVCDAAFFKGKNVIVVGGGDAAMEDALALCRFSKSVKIVHRRDSFRASKAMIEKVQKKEMISVLWNSAVDEIQGSQFVERAVIKNVVTGETEIMPIDGVFVAVGHNPATAFLKGTVALDEMGYIKTGVTYPPASASGESIFKIGYPTATNVEGVFAAGDCVDFRYRQASTAAGFGVMAALDAERWLETK
jgi:thioredoxin reductase (NADPH)